MKGSAYILYNPTEEAYTKNNAKYTDIFFLLNRPRSVYAKILFENASFFPSNNEA